MSLVRKRKAAASVLLMLTFNEEEETVHAKRGKTRKWIKRREEKNSHATRKWVPNERKLSIDSHEKFEHVQSR